MMLNDALHNPVVQAYREAQKNLHIAPPWFFGLFGTKTCLYSAGIEAKYLTRTSGENLRASQQKRLW
jgi:hypothetical protein